MDDVIVKGMPESLRRYVVETCGIPASAFHILSGNDLPEPERQLLFHPHDMTSTLERFHGSELFVDRLKNRELEGVYFREVFLRTRSDRSIAEYGVIAIVLNSFTAEQRQLIEAAHEPLGGLLHDFKISFKSSPVCYFSIAAEYLVNTSFNELKGPLFYGRFNQLTKTSGECIAWIMEILPEDAVQKNC